MFYTYMWLREDGTPYYVGKGSRDRAYFKRSHRLYPPPMDRIVFYIAANEQDALDTEAILIWYYGRKDIGTGILRNLTDGGENPPRVNWLGRKHSEATRTKIGISGKGREVSKATREKISRTNKAMGKVPPSALGKKRTEETKRKMSLSMRGIKHHRKQENENVKPISAA